VPADVVACRVGMTRFSSRSAGDPSEAVLAAERACQRLSFPGFCGQRGRIAAAVLQTLARRLDGIPLALELAGRPAWGALSLDQLNQGLATELSTLGSGKPAAPTARQQDASRQTIGWSYSLLDDVEQFGSGARLSSAFGRRIFRRGRRVWRSAADERVAVGAGSWILLGFAGREVNRQTRAEERENAPSPKLGSWENDPATYGRAPVLPRESTRESESQRAASGMDGRAGEIRWRPFELASGSKLFQDAWTVGARQSLVRPPSSFCLREPACSGRSAAELAHHHLVPYWTCRGPFW